jgi:hypothetical protein
MGLSPTIVINTQRLHAAGIDVPVRERRLHSRQWSQPQDN